MIQSKTEEAAVAAWRSKLSLGTKQRWNSYLREAKEAAVIITQ